MGNVVRCHLTPIERVLLHWPEGSSQDVIDAGFRAAFVGEAGLFPHARHVATLRKSGLASSGEMLRAGPFARHQLTEQGVHERARLRAENPGCASLDRCLKALRGGFGDG
tara:strand:- start:2403 stop:2732 length:330 start_codon:yes stop_codon:yes gene_type:complete